MSKKKLLLASAVFAVGSFLTACGGGDGEALQASGGDNNNQNQENNNQNLLPPTTIKKVLAVAKAASAGVQGAQHKYYVFSLKDDGTLEKSLVSNDSSFDIPMYGIHEFANGNKLLQDEAQNLYLYDQANNKIVNLNYTAPNYGINGIDRVTPTYIAEDGGNTTIILSDGSKFTFQNNGMVAADVIYRGNYAVGVDINGDLVMVDLTNGNKTVIEAGATVTNIYDREKEAVLVKTSNKSYLIMDNGNVAELPADANFNVHGATWNDVDLAKVGSDYYLVVGDQTNNKLYYMKVSGTTVQYDTAIAYYAPANVPANGRGVIHTEIELDASGNLFTVLGIDTNNAAGADTYKPRVYSNPASLVSYEPTSSYASLSFKDLNGATAGTPEMVGDGVAIYYDGTNYLFVNTSATVTTPGVPTGFTDMISCMATTTNIVMYSGNTFVCVNADNTNDDPTYYAEISSSGVLKFTKGKIANGAATLNNASMQAKLGSTTYYADSVNKIYACTLAETPCTKLSNVVADDLAPTAPSIETQANQIGTLHIASKSLVVTHNNNNCTDGTNKIPTEITGAVIVDIENDSKTNIPINMSVSCMNAGINADDDAVYLKASLNIDLSGAVAYGTNPVLSPKCAATGGFDELNVRLENGTTLTYNLADEGLCLVSPLGFVK